MEIITKYRAIDGVEFNDKDKCLEYEALISQVKLIMSQLQEKPTDDGCSFSNGGGYLQHSKTLVRKVKVQILELCKDYIDHKWIQQAIDDETVHPSWVGRLVSDYGIRPLNEAWGRFSCMDKKCREWGQPYYANNPEEAKQIEL